MSNEVIIEDIVKIENKDFYILEDKLGEECCINANGRKMYILKVQETNRKGLSTIEYLTRENLSIGDNIKIN